MWYGGQTNGLQMHPVGNRVRKAGSEPVKVWFASLMDIQPTRLNLSLLSPVKYFHRRPMRCDHVYMP